MIQYGHSSQPPRAGACLRVSEVEAHSPAGLNLLSAMAGLLTRPLTSAPSRSFRLQWHAAGSISRDLQQRVLFRTLTGFPFKTPRTRHRGLPAPSPASSQPLPADGVTITPANLAISPHFSKFPSTHNTKLCYH